MTIQALVCEVQNINKVGVHMFLGYSKFEWIFSVIVTIPIIYFFNVWLSDEDEPRPERATAAEIMECKDRIERRFSNRGKVDVSAIIGTSSDKLGPGGTSRVRMAFSVEDRSGVVVKQYAVCQFAEGVAALSLSN